MQKREAMLGLISVFSVMLINFASASFHYGGFGLGTILDSIDPSTMILGIIFIIVFAFTNYALSRFFRDNRATAGVISLAISLGVIWIVNRSGFDFGVLFYSIGFSEEVLVTVVPLALLGILIFAVFKYGFGASLMILGGILIILSLADFIYSKVTTFILGSLFLVIGIWLWNKKKDRFIGSDHQSYDYPQRRSPSYSYPRQNTPSRPSSRQVYKQELKEKRYNEKVRQSQIKARAKNIQKIREVRERRDNARERRREQKIRKSDERIEPHF